MSSLLKNKTNIYFKSLRHLFSKLLLQILITVKFSYNLQKKKNLENRMLIFVSLSLFYFLLPNCFSCDIIEYEPKKTSSGDDQHKNSFIILGVWERIQIY